MTGNSSAYLKAETADSPENPLKSQSEDSAKPIYEDSQKSLSPPWEHRHIFYVTFDSDIYIVWI